MPRVPQPEESLARPRSRKGSTQPQVTRGEALPCKQPRARTDWDAGVKQLWQSIGKSGQCAFYQASDWAYAQIVLDELNRLRASSRPSAEALRAVFASLDRLMLTETERRRARIELAQPPESGPSAAVLAIADYKRDLGVDAD